MISKERLEEFFGK